MASSSSSSSPVFSESVVKGCLAAEHPSSFIDRWRGSSSYEPLSLSFPPLLWGIFALWEGSLSGGKENCDFWSCLGTQFIFMSAQLSEVVTGALKELERAEASAQAPSEAAVEGRRRTEQAPRRALNCPRRLTEIGSSSGQLNWFQHSLLVSVTTLVSCRFSLIDGWGRIREGSFLLFKGCISMVAVPSLLSNRSVINLCNFKEQVRKYL